MDEAEISWNWDLFKQVQKNKIKSELPLKKNSLIHIHAVLKFWLASTPFLKIEN